MTIFKTDRGISLLLGAVLVLTIWLVMVSVRLYRLNGLVAAHQSNSEYLRVADDRVDTQDLSSVGRKLAEAWTDLLRQDLNNTRLAYDVHHNQEEYCGSLKAIYKRGNDVIAAFEHLPRPIEVGIWKSLAKGEYLNVCGDVQELESP